MSFSEPSGTRLSLALRLLIFPVLAALFIALGLLWGKDSLTLYRHGERTAGTVTAMLKIRPGETQTVIRLDQQLFIELADGRLIATPDIPETDEPLRKKINAALSADYAALGNLIAGEASSANAERIVRLTRAETATLENGETVVTVAELSVANETVQKTIGPRADFMMYEDSIDCTFRPVFTYTNGTQRVTLPADIGMRLHPPDGYELHRTVPVAYRPGRPEQAVLLPDFDRIRAIMQEKPVIGINQYVVAILGRWFYPIVLTGTGLVFAIIGLTLISLAVKPPHTEEADAPPPTD
jgi:hypothetical protein